MWVWTCEHADSVAHLHLHTQLQLASYTRVTVSERTTGWARTYVYVPDQSGSRGQNLIGKVGRSISGHPNSIDAKQNEEVPNDCFSDRKYPMIGITPGYLIAQAPRLRNTGEKGLATRDQLTGVVVRMGTTLIQPTFAKDSHFKELFMLLPLLHVHGGVSQIYRI